MMDFLSYKSDAASAPPHPAAFRLVGMPFPLAGLNDTYWLARAIWLAGQGGDEGFLIYADCTHYLFLDDAEAHTASVLIGAFQPQLRRPTARWRRAHRVVSTYLRRLRILAFLQTQELGSLANVLLRPLELPGRVCLALTLLAFFLCLGFHALLLPAPVLGIWLVLPIALASWCFGWRGSLWMVVSTMVIAGTGAFLTPGHASWSLPWLLSFALGSLGALLVGLFIAALRQITNSLLAQLVQQEHNQLAEQQELPQRTLQPLLNLEHEAGRPFTSIQDRLAGREMRTGYAMVKRQTGERESEQPDTGHYFALTLTNFPVCESDSPGQMEALALD